MATNVQAREVPTPTAAAAIDQGSGKSEGQKTEREPALQVDQIQGNILAGFNKDNQTLIFVDIKDTVKDIHKFKTWLGAIVPFVASTEEVLQFNRLFKMVRARRKVESRAVLSTWLNIAFSFRGLKKLVKKEADEFKDEAFRAGLAKRSHLLNDPPSGEGSPEEWLIGGKNNEADLVFTIGSDSLEEMGYAVRRLESWIYEGAELNGVLVPSCAAVIYKQKGAVLPSPLTGHEQFGFLDGVSQPGVRGTVGKTEEFFTPRQNPADPTQGKPGQDCLWPGEFVFGYPGQSPTDSDAKGKVKMDGPDWAKNGSYLVFRRLRQDVGGFHDFLKQEGDRLNLGPELFGAKCVGRWASGAPIERAPLQDNEKMSRDDCANNAFEFQDGTIPGVPKPDSGECKDNFPKDLAKEDRQGAVCPFAGHIRKAYPRDDVSLNPKKTTFAPDDASTELHRMLRRGIPFGDPFDPTVIPDDGNRGLLFVAYQTSIVDQFEFVTRNWVNNPDFKDPGAGHDPILGQTNQNGSRQRFFKLELPNGQPQTIRLPKDFVIPTGGGYFFAPSIKALQEHLSV